MPDFDLDAALSVPDGGDDGVQWVEGHEGIDEWDDDDIEQAASEGWGLFGDGWGGIQLQALDGADPHPVVFGTDLEAWRYVWDQRQVNYVCAKALRLLREHPRELNAIRANVR